MKPGSGKEKEDKGDKTRKLKLIQDIAPITEYFYME